MTQPRQSRSQQVEITELQWAFLNDAELPENADQFEVLELRYAQSVGGAEPLVEKLWKLYGPDIVEQWAKDQPGTRPSLWWRYSAPRSAPGPYPVCHYDGTLPEPRQRLGGVGAPSHEVLAYSPQFAFGVPVAWVEPWMVEYYNGRRKDVHGKPITDGHTSGTFAGLAPDPADPPAFESEAAYLERHGLLLPGERRRLKPADFEPETLSPSTDGDDK